MASRRIVQSRRGRSAASYSRLIFGALCARFNSLTSVAAIHCLVASVLADQAGSTPLESRMPSHCNSLCTVEGSVFNPATGAPLKKAAVVVNRTDVQPNLNAPPPSYNTTTDAAGKFAMKDIEPGKYRMTVTRNGFVTMTYGARGPTRPGTTLTLERAQKMKEVNFRLTPHGVVAGRVVDEDGEPIPFVSVQLVRFQVRQGRPPKSV